MKYCLRILQAEAVNFGDATEPLPMDAVRKTFEQLVDEVCKVDQKRLHWRGFWLEALEKVELTRQMVKAYCAGVMPQEDVS